MFVVTGMSCGRTQRVRLLLGLTLTMSAIACCQASTHGAPRRAISPVRTHSLRGIDLDGKLHRLGEAPRTKAVVIVFLSVDCPISNGHIPTLNKLAGTYRRRGVECYGVICQREVTRRQAATHRRDFRIGFPVLFDASGELRRRLSPTHTPHAFLLDAKHQRHYDGMIDDRYVSVGRKKQEASRHYLESAIKALLAGRDPEVEQTTPIGCLLEATAIATTENGPTFARDIAPIVQANCVDCHRVGQAAPFSLETYIDVSRHARQIVAVTRSRFMPPWKPAPDFGHFRDARRLSDKQIRLIERWVSAGKPKGDPHDLPPVAKLPGGWRLGKPDLVLELKRDFRIPSSGKDFHQYFVFPLSLPRNQVVTAVEFRTESPQVVHHASFFFDSTRRARRLDADDPRQGYRRSTGPGFSHHGTLRSWLPGMRPRRLPKGTGRLVVRGSDLVVEVHYHPRGKIERDRFKVGLHLESSTNKKLVAELQVHNKRLRIPAGARRHHHRSTYVLPVDTVILDAAPHMHLLGREMRAVATTPHGRTVPLIWIKDWDFNWQGQYSYMRPIALPKGTRINIDCWFDNSRQNPFNPHSPPRAVAWGPDTTDEMDICHFQCTCSTIEDVRTLLVHHTRYIDQQGGF